MAADPRHLLERLLGPEGVGRDPGGLARAFPDTAESLAEVLALGDREMWQVRLEGRGSWLAADAPGDVAISASVGSRPSSWVRNPSAFDILMRCEFWLSGMRTDLVCSASALRTAWRTHHTA